MFNDDLDEIIFLMQKYVLMVKDNTTGKYRPASCCKRQDCYDVLFRIQEILGTNKFYLSETGEFIRKNGD